jgi:hypothetical protein
MYTSTFQSAFNTWLDHALAEPIAPEVIAFSFNLTKPNTIEVIGAKFYRDDDPDWASEEAFRPETSDFSLPSPERQKDWAVVLECAKRAIYTYLERASTGSAILKKATAVAVGFIDGDLHKVWPG